MEEHFNVALFLLYSSSDYTIDFFFLSHQEVHAIGAVITIYLGSLFHYSRAAVELEEKSGVLWFTEAIWPLLIRRIYRTWRRLWKYCEFLLRDVNAASGDGTKHPAQRAMLQHTSYTDWLFSWWTTNKLDTASISAWTLLVWHFPIQDSLCPPLTSSPVIRCFLSWTFTSGGAWRTPLQRYGALWLFLTDCLLWGRLSPAATAVPPSTKSRSLSRG